MKPEDSFTLTELPTKANTPRRQVVFFSEARSQPAFTLTELLVVIAIMALVTIMTIPVLSPIFKTRAVDSSASMLQGAVTKARSLAATMNSMYFLAFNTMQDHENMVAIYDDTNRSKILDSNDLMVDSAIMLAKGAKFATAQGTKTWDKATGDWTNHYIKFFPTGGLAGSGMDDTAPGIFTIKIIDEAEEKDGTIPAIDKVAKEIKIQKLTGNFINN